MTRVESDTFTPRGGKPPLAGFPIGGFGSTLFGFGKDEAAYIIGLGRFVRPSLSIPGKDSYEWPLGTEGCRLFGSAKLALHSYIGDNEVVVEVMHRDESRIEMTGVFPGSTGTGNMLELRDLLVQVAPEEGMILALPKIFPKTQRVFMENYDFGREATDRGGTWTYTITFVRTGIGKKVPIKKTIGTPGEPTVKHHHPAEESVLLDNTFSVHVNDNGTIRKLAKIIHGNPRNFPTLMANNDKTFQNLSAQGDDPIPFHQIVTRPLPTGIRIKVTGS